MLQPILLLIRQNLSLRVQRPQLWYRTDSRWVVRCDGFAAEARGQDRGPEAEGAGVVGCAEDLGGELGRVSWEGRKGVSLLGAGKVTFMSARMRVRGTDIVGLGA
jgi:hypothetical protein